MKYTLNSARALASQGQFKESLTHYLLVLRKIEDITGYRKEFLSCLTKYIETQNLQPDCITPLISPVLDLFAGDAVVHLAIGELLGGRHMFKEALDVFRTMLASCNPSEKLKGAVRVCQANFTSHLFPTWHMIMLNNKKRNSVYADAIRRIAPGKTVLEIGSGTGLLSAVAHSHGLNVIAVEESEQLAEVTRTVLEMNRVHPDTLCRSIPCNSKNLDIEKEIGAKADVLVAEIFDCCALGEGVIESFVDAHRRLTIPNAIFIPNNVTIYVRFLQSESLWNVHGFGRWRSEYVNTGDAFPSDPYWCGPLSDYKDVKFLSEAVTVMHVNLTDVEHLEKLLVDGSSGILGVDVTHDGTIHCLAVHWRASLGEDLVLDSSMDGSCWDLGIYPVRNPRPVRSGEELAVTLALSDGGRRLDLVLSEELSNDHADMITLPGKYMTLCRDRNFAHRMCSQIPGTASSVCITVPFDYESAFGGRFREMNVLNPEDDTFGAVLVKDELQAIVEMDVVLDRPYPAIIFWPVQPDGSLDDQSLAVQMPLLISAWNEDYLRQRKNGQVRIPRSVCIPGSLRCVGQLICADSLGEKSRLQSDTHLNFNLKTPHHAMRLFEARDLRMDAFSHTLLSAEFPIFNFNLQEIFNDPIGDHSFNLASNAFEVECDKDGEVDGVLYWWKAAGYESKSQPLAAFVFGKRYTVTKGQKLPIRVDVYRGQLLVTLATEDPSI